MGVKYLLDTHVVLWLLGDPERVPERIRNSLADRSNDLFVSAISVLEIATKGRLGKLPHSLVSAWDEHLARLAAHDLPVNAAHAGTAGRLDWEHRDVFDRVLVGQSLIEGMALVTNDRAIRAYAGATLLYW